MQTYIANGTATAGLINTPPNRILNNIFTKKQNKQNWTQSCNVAPPQGPALLKETNKLLDYWTECTQESLKSCAQTAASCSEETNIWG